MRLAIALFMTTVGSGLAGAQVTKGACDQPFETSIQAGSEIRMHVRSGDVDVVGHDAETIRITCEFRKHPDAGRDVSIKLSRKPGSADLSVSGGPINDARFRIEVPRNSHLWLRCPAGDLSLTDVAGNKDIELHAGDLVIEVGNPAEYAQVDGSVKAGDLNARPFGVSKGGLFRSFRQSNPSGKYQLHAHVGAGGLVLK